MSRLVEAKRRVARRAGRGYIVGPRLEDALAVAAAIDRPVTLGFWDAPGADPGDVAQAYIDTVEALATMPSDGYISVKLPSLRSDPGAADRVAAAARAADVLLHFDSLAEDAATETIELALRLAKAGSRVGATVPGAWSRSVADACALTAAGVRIRIVKGQWPGDRDPRAGFLDIVDAIQAAGSPIAFATHDTSLAHEALERAAGSPAELELLYGLPLGAPATAAAEHGVPVRIYLPFGRGYIPYALSRVYRRPVILWWLARDAALGRHSTALANARRHPSHQRPSRPGRVQHPHGCRAPGPERVSGQSRGDEGSDGMLVYGHPDRWSIG